MTLDPWQLAQTHKSSFSCTQPDEYQPIHNQPPQAHTQTKSIPCTANPPIQENQWTLGRHNYNTWEAIPSTVTKCPFTINWQEHQQVARHRSSSTTIQCTHHLLTGNKYQLVRFTTTPCQESSLENTPTCGTKHIFQHRTMQYKQ